MAKEGKARGEGGERSPGGSNRLVAVLGVLTALLTCATAAFGLFGLRAEQQRTEAESEASALTLQVVDLSATIAGLESERDSIESERDSMQAEIVELEQQRDQLRASLDEAAQISTDDFEPDSAPTYLGELEPVSGPSFTIDSREVHGRQTLRSIVQELECPTAIEWNLGGRYQEFTAWAGLDDESRNRDARARFTVIADGEVLDEVVLGLTEHKEFAVDIEGRFRLILEMELISPDRCFYHAEGVWGDATIR